MLSPEVGAVFESLMKGGAAKVKLEIEEVGLLGATDICFERSTYTFYKENGDLFIDGRCEMNCCLVEIQLG